MPGLPSGLINAYDTEGKMLRDDQNKQKNPAPSQGEAAFAPAGRAGGDQTAENGEPPRFTTLPIPEPHASLHLPKDDLSQQDMPASALIPPVSAEKPADEGGATRSFPAVAASVHTAPPASPTTAFPRAKPSKPAGAPRKKVFTFGRGSTPDVSREDFDAQEILPQDVLHNGHTASDTAAPKPARKKSAPSKAGTPAAPAAGGGAPPAPPVGNARPFWADPAPSRGGFLGWLKGGKGGGTGDGGLPPDDGSAFAPRKRQRNAFVGLGLLTLRLLVVVVLLAGMAAAGAGIGIAKAYMDTTPTLNLDKLTEQDLSSFVYDGNGELITTIAGMENRIYAPISEIPDMLQKAFIAIEDNRFETHNGVDLKRIAGAFFNNLRSSSVNGGSTITQQLIKLQVLSSERTYKRKIQEAWLALQLETKYSKDQILEAYLNAIPLGQSNYGVKAAAQDYFGKDLSQLSLRECAMLAGLTQSPYTYDPRANTYTRNRMDLTDRRTDTVLMRMYQCGYITKEEYQAALEDDVFIVEKSEYKSMYDMPYFVEYAIQDVVNRFLEARGLEDTAANRQAIQNELRTGGYHIYTTVDPTVQNIVEDTLYNWTKYPSMRYSQDKYTVVSTSDNSFTRIEQPQAAAVVYDYHTGQLKAIVGGRSQPTARLTFNRAYQSHMPVGSSIKPLAVYGPALDLGLSPATPILNAPVPIEGWDTERGYPNNYGGGGFTGIISLREAVKKSLNVVAARTLLEDVGVSTSVDYLHAMGITDGINEDGAGLALGTSGISPLQMAVAYGTLGNSGEYVEAFSFTKVTDSHGKVLLDADQLRQRTQVFKPTTAYMMTDILIDAVQSGTGTRAKISGMTVAGKTGTNSDNVGVSFGGLTPYYSAFVWIGHDNYKALASSATGSTAAAPLWQAFMSRIHSDLNLPNANIIDATPESLGLVKATVCSVSGKLATEACEQDQDGHIPVTDYFAPGTVPVDECDMHQILEICDASGKIATQYCPEDQITEKAILAVPEDSPLRLLSAEDLAQYFPSAVLDYPTGDALAEFTPDNPDYADYFCPIHTADWEKEQQDLSQAKVHAQQTITQIQQSMDQASWLSDEGRSQLNTHINAIKTLMNSQSTTAEQLNQAVTELKDLAKTLLTQSNND